jgi:GTP-dependent dephospho-CoA kinase
MSIYKISCKTCSHIFYDISVLCNSSNLDITCPICKSKDTIEQLMKKPEDKVWAEEEGCYHENLDSEQIMNTDNHGCSSCSHGCSQTKQEKLTLDEEVDLRVKKNLKKIRNYKMPKAIEGTLKKAWGSVLNEVPIISKTNKIITIGDISTKELLKKLYRPILSIVDNKVNRELLPENLHVNKKFYKRVLSFDNPAGTISRKLYRTIERIDFNNVEERTLLIINGEEDLATLACLIHAPLDSHVFYGQPEEGLVHIILDEKIRRKALEVFSQFE